MTQREIAFFNSLASSWDETRAADDRKIAGLVGDIGLREGENVLDIGCGTGVLLPFIKEHIGADGRITAVDFAQNMLSCAAEKHRHLQGISYVVSDIMQFTSEVSFDIAISLNFFPHVKDKSAFLSHIRSLLGPGGRLILMHDIPRSKVNAIHRGSAEVSEDRLPSAESVSAMLCHSGYEVEVTIDNEQIYFIKARKR